MLQPCRAGLGPQLSIDQQPELRKQEIHHPASAQRLHSAKIRCALSIDRQSRGGRGERLGMRIERKVVRPRITRHSAKIALVCVRVRSELQESVFNVHKTAMAADLYHHASIHHDLAIPPH
jgi:hypothetical protein